MKKLIALFALVAVFAACEPESLQTAYTVADATAKVNVTLVTCPYPGFDPADVTFTYAWSSGTPTDDPTMVTGNPTIAAGSVAITAEYMGLTGTTTVGYPKVYAGGQYEFTATVAIPYNAGDYTLSVVFDDPEDPELLFYKVLQESIDHGTEILYPFEYMDETFEIPMVENASEMVLTDSYSYQDYTGFALEDDLTMVNDDFTDLVNYMYESMFEANEGVEQTDVDYPFSVSAFALYNVINPVFAVQTYAYFIAEPNDASVQELPYDGVVAYFSMDEFQTGAQVFEVAHPSHADHYVAPTEDGHYYGNGIKHGNNNNAGGGIIEAE